MTSAQEQYKKNLIQKIQVNKSKVFTEDQDRREFMFSRFGVDSTTKMSIDQLKLLLDFCQRKVSDIPISIVTQAQLYKITKLWKDKARNKSKEALIEFVKRFSKEDLSTLENITKHEATKIIIALERI